MYKHGKHKHYRAAMKKAVCHPSRGIYVSGKDIQKIICSYAGILVLMYLKGIMTGYLIKKCGDTQ